MVLIQGGAIRPAAKRFGDRRLLAFGICGGATGLAFMGLATSLSSLTISVLLTVSAAGFVAPSLTSLVSQISADEVQGGILGLNQAMSSLGRIFGPLAGTTLFELISPRFPFFLFALLLLTTIAGVLLIKFPQSTGEILPLETSVET